MIETIIKRNLKCAYHLGKGISEKQYSVSWNNIENAHLLFYYQSKWKCYLVWNASVMLKTNRKTVKANFIFESEAISRLNSQTVNGIEVFEKNIFYNGNYDYFEKMVVVPEEKLFDFCENYEYYIYPSEEDVKHRKYLFALQNSENIIELVSDQNSYNEVIRERDRISRARRDPDFRDRVLKKYNYTCIVCGCKEPAILEAAHIKSIADGGDDSTNNGICLCRNHHKLYDAALLDVDFINKKFSCKSGTEKEMAWYKEAMLNDCKLVGV